MSAPCSKCGKVLREGSFCKDLVCPLREAAQPMHQPNVLAMSQPERIAYAKKLRFQLQAVNDAIHPSDLAQSCISKQLAPLAAKLMERVTQPVQQPAAVVGQYIPRNFTTHRSSWRAGLETAKRACENEGLPNQALYWGHEIEAFDRAFARLLDKPEPIRTAVPAAGVQGDDLIGMSVSVDVSTGDDDAGNRLFGTVEDVQQYKGAKHGLMLLITDPKPNFDTAQPDSGRDAALAVLLRECLGVLESVPTDYVIDLASRISAALAAHPAPSSDAGVRAYAQRMDEASIVFTDPYAHSAPSSDAGLEARRAMFAAYSECLTSTDMLPTEISDKLLAAAHHANGAQAGLSDEEIDAIWLETAKRYADYKQFARAILAAAKKGGA